VFLSGEELKHFNGVRCVGRLFKDGIAKHDDRIGAENNLAGMARDRFRLVPGEPARVIFGLFPRQTIFGNTGDSNAHWNTGPL
jgi:hypothetical protein